MLIFNDIIIKTEKIFIGGFDMRKKVIILETPHVNACTWNTWTRSTDLEDIMFSWQEYKQEHLNLPIDLFFEFWRGSDIFWDFDQGSYYTFTMEELLNVKQKIDELINSNQLFGLILPNRLTREEMEKEKPFYLNMKGPSFIELYQYFYKKIPTFFVNQTSDCCWKFLDDEHFEEIREIWEIFYYYVSQNYLPDESCWIQIDRIDGYRYPFMMKNFFDCCLNYFFKMQEEKLGLALIKKD